MKKSYLLISLLVLTSLILAACGGAATEEPVSLEGAVVTIFTAAGEEQARVFEQNFVGFEERTGIDVVVEGSPDFETLAVVRSEAGDPYDILNFPQPGLMASMAKDGFLVDLGEFITNDELQAAYTQSWIDLGTVDGAVVGVWHGADVKSLVWYAKPAFDAAGYEIPQTWAELIALSDQIVADGSVPWCVGIESGGASGWPGTDWVEDIMLRTQSPEKYDAWTRGELKFDSPEVRNAFDELGKIWFKEGYVLGGTTGILTTNFGDAPTPLFDSPPSCFLHRQASFIPNFFPEGSEIGVDVDYFYLPPMGTEFGKPVLGSGNLISLAKDSPAGREVVKFMLTAESIEAEVKAGNALAAMKGVPSEWYPSTTLAGFADILANADTFRFDGSDLMPGEVGAGSFWTGTVDWVGGKSLDDVLPAIDAAWPAD